MSPDQDILGPAITERAVARPLIQAAVTHFREARRATIQVMADLRRLQDGQVHALYGYTNFAKWAEDTFEGLAAGNVRQLCRAGAVALELDRRGLIDLNNPKGVGTTGLRALSVVAGTYGDDKMAEVFVTALNTIEPGVWVSGTNVEAAMQLLTPPAQVDQAVLDEQSQAEAEYEEDTAEEQTEYSATVTELMNRIQDLSWDLPDSTDDLEDATHQLKRQIAQETAEGDQTWIEGTR